MDEDEPTNKSDVQTSFRHEIIKEILKTRFNNPKNKISEDAIELLSEIAKILATEAAVRAIKQAKHEYKTRVTLEHIEAILPQIDKFKTKFYKNIKYKRISRKCLLLRGLRRHQDYF